MSNFYKSTINGNIPNDWNLVSIDEIADVTAGGTPNTKVVEYWGGTIPWMNSGEINLRRIKDVENRITELGLKNSSTKIIDKHSVLMALAGQGKTRGKVAINEFPLCTNQSLATIYNFKKASYEFIFQNLESRYSEIRKMSTGDGGRGGLNLKIIKSIKIGLPPLPEQQKIADILSTVDAKIEVIDQQITETQELKKGLMQRLLTKGIGHTEFKDSVLGEIPVDWEVVRINEVTSYVDYRGKTPPKVNSGILLVTARNIKMGKIDYEVSKEFIPSDSYDSVMSRGVPKIGDVLITTEAPLGNIASVDKEDIALAQRVIKYRGNKDVLDNSYLKQYMIGSVFQRLLEKQSTGSTVKGIKGSVLHKLNIALPSFVEQQQIAEILSSVDEKLEALSEKKATYQELKKGLMQQLLTGLVRVKV
jgi:type I restriction enzyme S subunit